MQKQAAECAADDSRTERREPDARINRVRHARVRSALYDPLPFANAHGRTPIRAEHPPRPEGERKARDDQQHAQHADGRQIGDEANADRRIVHPRQQQQDESCVQNDRVEQREADRRTPLRRLDAPPRHAPDDREREPAPRDDFPIPIAIAPHTP